VETSGANVAAPGDDPDEGGRARVNLPPAERPSDTKGGGTSLADIIDALPGGSVDVRTAAGEPVANAEVIVFQDGSTFARGRTDESGSAGAMSAGDGARILVIAPGRPAVIVDPTEDGDTVVIVPDGLVVEGLVRVDGAAPREPIQLTLRADLPVIRRGDVPNDRTSSARMSPPMGASDSRGCRARRRRGSTFRAATRSVAVRPRAWTSPRRTSCSS
jgi:hypothetical protein